MSLACQRDSYLREFQTVVKTCRPSTTSVLENGKTTKMDGFDIILEDTILFPEGGGQPDDRGVINDVPVHRIIRIGKDAVNFTLKEIPAGTDVKLELDWQRRFDHMQQHTAQHLMTALIDHRFRHHTTSWNIGTDIVTIELDTAVFTMDQALEVEKVANGKIRTCIPVTPSLYEDKNDPELQKFRGLGLPADHEGPVRVLTIEGIDNALCCGTHVSNLSHIQAIKVIGTEKGKKNKMNLLFLAGDRLLKYVGESYHREKTLTGILKGQAGKHCELADKAVKGYKALQKSCNQQLREIATLEATLFKEQKIRDVVFVKHRKDGDNDYISVLIGELEDKSLPKLITIGDEKEGGMFVLAGPDEMLEAVGQQICDIFEGKGACSKGVFRGKAMRLANRGKAESLLRDYVEKHLQHINDKSEENGP